MNDVEFKDYQPISAYIQGKKDMQALAVQQQAMDENAQLQPLRVKQMNLANAASEQEARKARLKDISLAADHVLSFAPEKQGAELDKVINVYESETGQDFSSFRGRTDLLPTLSQIGNPAKQEMALKSLYEQLNKSAEFANQSALQTQRDDAHMQRTLAGQGSDGLQSIRAGNLQLSRDRLDEQKLINQRNFDIQTQKLNETRKEAERRTKKDEFTRNKTLIPLNNDIKKMSDVNDRLTETFNDPLFADSVGKYDYVAGKVGSLGDSKVSQIQNRLERLKIDMTSADIKAFGSNPSTVETMLSFRRMPSVDQGEGTWMDWYNGDFLPKFARMQSERDATAASLGIDVNDASLNSGGGDNSGQSNQPVQPSVKIDDIVRKHLGN